MTGATIQCLSHSANPAIEFGAAGWIPTSIDLLTRQVPLYVGHSSKTLELARSLELRSGAYRAPALPVELYQRSWRGDSNADHGLTRPALFPLSYTSTKLLLTIWRQWGELHSRLSALQADALLSWLHRLEPNPGAEGGTRTRALDVGNVASWPLDDFRLERAARVELASSGWKPEAPSAIPCSLLAGDEGLEPS